MEDKYLDLIAKYLSNEISEEEREALFGWVNESSANQGYFEEMQDLWAQSGDYEAEIEVDVDRAWSKVAPRVAITPPPVAPPVRKLPRVQLWKSAAVFIGIVIASMWWWQNTNPEILIAQTSAQEKKHITLPDGSQVWLNENTEIKYSEDFEPRFVELTGEAFFEVVHLEKDQTFEIKSEETLTKVLGTSFNVRAYPEEEAVEVTVETGKVAFAKEKKSVKEKVLLTAGKSGIFNKKKATISAEPTKIINANAWKTAELNFENANLNQVIRDLERYFGIQVEVSDARLLECHLTTFHEQPKLDEVLAIIEEAMDIEITKNQNTYIISGEGCN